MKFCNLGINEANEVFSNQPIKFVVETAERLLKAAFPDAAIVVYTFDEPDSVDVMADSDKNAYNDIIHYLIKALEAICLNEHYKRQREARVESGPLPEMWGKDRVEFKPGDDIDVS